MKVAFEGIGRQSATFAASDVAAGQVCKMKENGAVTACADGDVFIGVVEGLRKGHAGVQLHGFAQLSYTGTAPGLGYVALAADGSGGVKTADTGRSVLVVQVDTGSMNIIAEL